MGKPLFESSEARARDFCSGLIFHVALSELLTRRSEVELLSTNESIGVRTQAQAEAALIDKGITDAGNILAGMGIES